MLTPLRTRKWTILEVHGRSEGVVSDRATPEYVRMRYPMWSTCHHGLFHEAQVRGTSCSTFSHAGSDERRAEIFTHARSTPVDIERLLQFGVQVLNA